MRGKGIWNMRCRCIDMNNCSNDISKIVEIKELFVGSKVLNTFVSVELQNIANSCMSTFNSVNMSSLMFKENRLNEEMIDLLPSLVNRCENKIEELQWEYSLMSREDYDYHHSQDLLDKDRVLLSKIYD
jgi:hypothetical protein